MKKSWVLRNLAVVLMLAVWGCATTNIESVKDPSANGKVYRNFLIAGNFNDLGQRKTAEIAFASAFSDQGIQAVPSFNVLLPTRTYSQEEASKILKEQGFDALLTVTLTQEYADQTYVPGSSSTDCTTDKKTGKVHCSTQNTPPRVINEPRIKCDLNLTDVATDKNAWVANTLTSGGEGTGFNTMMSSMAKEALAKLSKEGLVVLAPKPKK
jgi:hypothetical protein